MAQWKAMYTYDVPKMSGKLDVRKGPTNKIIRTDFMLGDLSNKVKADVSVYVQVLDGQIDMAKDIVLDGVGAASQVYRTTAESVAQPILQTIKRYKQEFLYELDKQDNDSSAIRKLNTSYTKKLEVALRQVASSKGFMLFKFALKPANDLKTWFAKF